VANQKRHPALTSVERQVIQNIEDLRHARGLSWRELEERLEAIGHPITGASRIGRGERRIDPTDLVALSIVFKVNPSALLFSRRARNDAMLELTPKVRQRAWVVWAWADGRAPLPDTRVDAEVEEFETPADQFTDFQVYARPHGGIPHTTDAERELENLRARIGRLVEDFGNPDTFDYRETYIVRSLKRSGLAIEELLADNRRAAMRSTPDPVRGPDGRLPNVIGGAGVAPRIPDVDEEGGR
jgi:hypothetical protein